MPGALSHDLEERQMPSSAKKRDPEQRVRELAYHLWLEEGKPQGRAQAHWDKARELAAIEENQKLATEPNPVRGGPDRTAQPEPVEPPEAVENQGEFPTLTDQGEAKEPPRRSRARATGVKSKAGATGAAETGAVGSGTAKSKARKAPPAKRKRD